MQNATPLTFGLRKCDWTLLVSAIVSNQQQFRLTNKAVQQFLTSTILQSQAAVPGWTL
jgi:hypothetical protein